MMRPVPSLAPTSRVAALLFSGALLAACGGSSPSQPSAPAPTPTATPVPPPAARDGIHGEPVAAAFDPPRPAFGQRVAAAAEGYLTREQLFEGGEIFLWRGEQDYIRDVAYWEFQDGSFRVIRWNQGFTLTLEDDLADDPVLVAKAEEVAAEASRHIGFPVRVGPGGAVTIGIDPDLADEDAVAQADLRTAGAVITGARITFVRRAEIAGGPRADYANTLLHEMGHVIGLGHSPDFTEVMTPGEGPGASVGEYQAGEAGCLRMIYAHRRAGNFFPDRDPALRTAAPSALRTTRILD